jgi:hypothetical protein
VCLVAMLLALILTFIIEANSPGSIIAWRTGIHSARTWLGATPVSYLRLLVQKPGAPVPSWPLIVGPIAASTYAIWYLLRRGRSFDKLRDLPLFSTLSVCSSPYLWCLDFPILLIAEISILIRLSSAPHTRSLIASSSIIVVARLALITQILSGVADYRTGWYPAAILLALVIHNNRYYSE